MTKNPPESQMIQEDSSRPLHFNGSTVRSSYDTHFFILFVTVQIRPWDKHLANNHLQQLWEKGNQKSSFALHMCPLLSLSESIIKLLCTSPSSHLTPLIDHAANNGKCVPESALWYDEKILGQSGSRTKSECNFGFWRAWIILLFLAQRLTQIQLSGISAMKGALGLY